MVLESLSGAKLLVKFGVFATVKGPVTTTRMRAALGGGMGAARRGRHPGSPALRGGMVVVGQRARRRGRRVHAGPSRSGGRRCLRRAAPARRPDRVLIRPGH